MSTQSRKIVLAGFPFNWLEKLIVRPGLPVDERRKRAYLMLFLLTTLPILFAFVFWRLLIEELTYAPYLLMLAISVGIGVFWVLRYAQHTLLSYRLGVLIILSLLVYLLASGESYGIAYIWFFFHPVAAFFLFGSREGLFWVVLSWLLCLLITVVNVGPYSYQLAIGLRFMVAYTLVSILAYGLEAARQYYYEQLAAEKLALEVAMQQVKTLQDLLPICASCKKIRDDKGYWHQVESYIRDHAGVEFSHGICPECRTQLYPMYAKGSAGDVKPSAQRLRSS
jgi:hypothetical protein